VRIDLDKPVRSFNGTANLGAGVDGMDEQSIEQAWARQHVASMKAPGFGPLAYRLRTELGSAAWHWNPSGTWSDPGQHQGYWLSADKMPKVEPGVSYGYDLPRRGNTLDQGNNAGYSRLTDGDLGTEWKSNPYLDPHFTKQSDETDPQWLMFSFREHAVSADTLKITWGVPYAKRIKVQYWVDYPGAAPSSPIGTPSSAHEHWQDFPISAFSGTGGVQTVRLAAAPMRVNYVRVQFTDSSATAPKGSKDVRDKLGFAVREVSLGHGDSGGFVDGVTHRPSDGQTIMYTSSTDPWHRATDLSRDYAQLSFKRVFGSGLTHGQPLMIPVPALYGVPEDAAALVRYLRAQHYPVSRIEIGEEPNGQGTQATDYAALYIQFADAIRSVDASIPLGGPGYETAGRDWYTWPSKADGNASWTGRFVSYLRAKGRLDQLDFFSFEWYPFDDVCRSATKSIADNPNMLAIVLANQKKDGLPANIPTVITEYGFSSYAGRVEVELPGAIFDAETAAKFLELGGATSYFYGLEPNWVISEGGSCNSWGNLMLFQLDSKGGRDRPLAPFYALELVNKQWIQPGSGRHELFLATSDTGKGQPLVTAYAVRRPDGKLSVLVFNKDPSRAISVRLETMHNGKQTPLPGNLDLFQYSGTQYRWDPQHPDSRSDNPGSPTRNLPPAHELIIAGHQGVLTLPAYSISVVRTR